MIESGATIPIWILLIAILLLSFLIYEITTKRKTKKTIHFILILGTLIALSAFIVGYIGFQEGIKINLEKELRDYCKDTNLTCEKQCYYWIAQEQHTFILDLNR